MDDFSLAVPWEYFLGLQMCSVATVATCDQNIFSQTSLFKLDYCFSHYTTRIKMQRMVSMCYIDFTNDLDLSINTFFPWCDERCTVNCVREVTGIMLDLICECV